MVYSRTVSSTTEPVEISLCGNGDNSVLLDSVSKTSSLSLILEMHLHNGRVVLKDLNCKRLFIAADLPNCLHMSK